MSLSVGLITFVYSKALQPFERLTRRVRLLYPFASRDTNIGLQELPRRRFRRSVTPAAPLKHRWASIRGKLASASRTLPAAFARRYVPAPANRPSGDAWGDATALDPQRPLRPPHVCFQALPFSVCGAQPNARSFQSAHLERERHRQGLHALRLSVAPFRCQWHAADGID